MSGLLEALGGAAVAGGKLKATGTTYWNSPNTGATDEFGFHARGSGYYSVMTGAQQKRGQFRIWTADEVDTPEADTSFLRLSFDTGVAALAGAAGGFVSQYLYPVRLVRSASAAVRRWREVTK
jgi:hypothetical protein